MGGAGEHDAPPALLCADLRSGTVRVWADHYRHRALRPPVDLVCDAVGGVYFSAFGGTAESLMDPGIYYCDGREVRLAVATLAPPIGVGLSPQGRWLYWTEYATGRLFRRQVLMPGKLAPPPLPYRDCLYAHPAPVTFLDSMTIDTEGQVTVAVHHGHPRGTSGLLTLSARGEPISFLRIGSAFATHVEISSNDEPHAYVALAHSGQIARLSWPHRGVVPRHRPPADLL